MSDERGGVSMWEMRDGIVHDRPCPKFGCVLRE